MVPGFPGANINEFWLTILSEAKRPQTQCLSPKGEFWVCSEASSRMVHNSFQRAKGNPGTRAHSMGAKKQRSHLIKIFYLIKSDIYKDSPMKTQETPVTYASHPAFPLNEIKSRDVSEISSFWKGLIDNAMVPA